MPKTILFPVTNRVHLPRQQLLLDELEKAGVRVLAPEIPMEGEGDMAARAAICAEIGEQMLKGADMVLIRGDRYEQLPLAMIAAYRGFPIVHIEAGDLSGAIDNKVRHAISQLADYWFPTNEPAHSRLVHMMGVDPGRVWNFGSLDVEVAMTIKPKAGAVPYAVFAFHPVSGESEAEALGWAQEALSAQGIAIMHIRSNGDYARPHDGSEQYTGERYLQLIADATILIGNSSSFLKEASVFGTPVVDIGRRQQDRLKPRHVINARTKMQVLTAIGYQLQHGRYDLPSPYLQEGTASKIAGKIKEILS